MAEWTDPSGHIYSPGEVLTAATMNTYVEQNLHFLGYTRPSCQVTSSVATVIPTGVANGVGFNTEFFKTDAGMHSNVTNNSYLTATVAGVYMVSACIEFAANVTGVRSLTIYANGSLTGLSQTVQAAQGGSVTQLSVTGMISLGLSSNVQAFAYQTSGGNLNVDGTGQTPVFSLTFMHF